MKHIILCADDFGLNKGVCQGILRLVHHQRLSAVSCMVNGSDFNVYGIELSALNNQIKSGLHFNLTEGYFLSEPNQPCFSLKELLVKTHLSLIKRSFIASEFNAQLDHYIKVMGKLPDFIDGHQHVHQFPKIRQVILDLYRKRLQENGTLIRGTYPAITLPEYRMKASLLSRLGGKALAKQLKKLNIPHNSCFAGVYDFSPKADYRALFRHWLKKVPDQSLVMCHPGTGIEPDDSIGPSRVLEFNYFFSNDFLTDCREYQVDLG